VLGVSVGGAWSSTASFVGSAALWLESPAGTAPLHVGGFAELDGRSTTNNNWLAGGTLRLGRDRRYWPHAHAGVGPMLSAGYDRYSGTFAMLGLELFGAD
jgi:hypothetical protein